MPAIDIDQPAEPLAIEVNDAALVIAIQKSGGDAWVGLKSLAVQRQRELRRSAVHPIKRNQTITRSMRPALSAAAARVALTRLESLGAQVVTYYQHLGFALVQIDPFLAPAIKADSAVDWIEPVPPPPTGFGMAAPLPPSALALLQSGQQIPWGVSMVGAPQVWPTTRGEGVPVLVLDGSLGATHPDFPTGINCYGWCSDDGTSHSTSVMGTVAARDNNVGTVGVAPGVAAGLLHLRGVCQGDLALPPGGGNDPKSQVGGITCPPQDVMLQLNWAAGNMAPRAVVNMSFGWPTAPGGAFPQAVATADHNGLLLVAAAGNLVSSSGGPIPGAVNYPAGFSQVLAVSALRSDSNFAQLVPNNACSSSSFGSNYGPHVDLAAPFEVLTTRTPTAENPAQYGHFCGTSAASPMVAGVAALVWKHFPSWSNQRLKEHLIATAVDRGAAGWDQNYGFGLTRAHLVDVFAPPTINATVTAALKPRITWAAVPAAGSYRVYRKVTPYNADFALWQTVTGTSFNDSGTLVTSFFGYDAVPAGTSVSYYVVAVTQSGVESKLYTRYATYNPNGIPPY